MLTRSNSWQLRKKQEQKKLLEKRKQQLKKLLPRKKPLRRSKWLSSGRPELFFKPPENGGFFIGKINNKTRFRKTFPHPKTVSFAKRPQ